VDHVSEFNIETCVCDTQTRQASPEISLSSSSNLQFLVGKLLNGGTL